MRSVTFRQFILEKCGTERGSQANLARAIGRSTATVTRWFDGSRSPDLASCLVIADELNLEPTEVMRAAGVPEKDISAFLRYSADRKPDERMLYGSEHAAIHRQLQRLIRCGLDKHMRVFVGDLSSAVDDLEERLRGCMDWSAAQAAQLRLDGKVMFQCGPPGDGDWKEMKEGRLTFSVRNPQGEAWEQVGEIYLKYVEMSLKLKGLLQ